MIADFSPFLPSLNLPPFINYVLSHFFSLALSGEFAVELDFSRPEPAGSFRLGRKKIELIKTRLEVEAFSGLARLHFLYSEH